VPSIARHILRVVSSYVRLCAEKQKQRRHAACSLRDASALLQCRSLARKPPPREFFSKSPPTERVSASAVADRTLHCQVRIRCFCFANATHAHLPVSLGCSSHRARRHRSLFSVGRGACHCRHSRAAMVSPTASQLRRQSHAFRLVPFVAFVTAPRGTALGTGLCAVTCGQRLPAPRPASCRAFPRCVWLSSQAL
jgi:hypothetical protein